MLSLASSLSLLLTKKSDSQRLQASSNPYHNHFFEFPIQKFIPFPSEKLKDKNVHSIIRVSPIY
jgi:hypothetical protein